MRFGLLLLFFIFLSDYLCALEFYSSRDLKPGMKGYGLTVVRGWEPETFQVEIIDVMKGVQGPGNDLVLVKLAGLNLEESGVVAGMSGSPVYVDGKLVGAVSYGDIYPKEPICMVTPIKDMVSEKDDEDGELPGDLAVSSNGFKNFSSPLYVAGFPGIVNNYLQEYFNSNSEIPIQIIGAGSSETAITDKGLKAGDGVAVNLVDGDFVAAGIGTVTYVSNKDVYIFGHTLGLAGNIRLPISKAYIYTVFPSYYHSIKIGTSSGPIGSTIVDGRNSVYCRLGEKASMVPLRVEIDSGGTNYINNFRVADSSSYFPPMAASAVSASFLNRTGNLDLQRLSMELTMDLHYKSADYCVSNFFTYGFYPVRYNIAGFLNDLSSYFTVFFNKAIGEVEIKKVNIKIRIERGLDYTVLEGVKIEKESYHPGDSIKLDLVLRGFDGNFTGRKISIMVPSDFQAGKYWIVVGSEASFQAEMLGLFPRYYQAGDFNALLALANLRQRSTILKAGLISGKPGLEINGQKMDNFPVRFIRYYPASSESAAYVYYPFYISSEEDTGKVIFGSEKVQVNILGPRKQVLNLE